LAGKKRIKNMSNIYERIGEALLSNGKHDIIRAESKHEEDVLAGAGFTKVGSLKEGENIIALFKIEQKTKEVVKVVQVPIIDTSPWNKKPNNVGDYPWNNRPYVMNYADTGTGDAGYMQYKGNTTSLMNAAYNPLSVLEDYNSQKTDNAEVMTNLLNAIAQNNKPVRNV
jgi:hypothetical protein